MKQQQDFLEREHEVYSKIAPALSLLDDPDESVSVHISQYLSSFGSSIVPIIRREIQEQNSTQAIHTLQTVLNTLQAEGLHEVKEYVLSCRRRQISPDLFTLFDLLSHFGYPESNAWIIEAQLNTMAEAVKEHIEITGAHNEEQRINSLNAIFFDQFSYRPPSSHYYLPEHCYFYSVTEKRIGIPLALSILYIILGNKSGIALQGIGMPLHFLVKSSKLDTFIDVYNYGVTLTKEDCLKFLIKAGIPYSESMLEPVDSEDMLFRMLRNLYHCYKREQAEWELNQIVSILEYFDIEH
jgi:hypothetical protein